MTKNGPLDHDEIRELGLVDQYLRDCLPEEERHRFEAHFVDCSECLAQLELAEEFETALRDAVTEDAARAFSGAGFLAAFNRLGRSRRLAVATLIGSLLLPAIWLTVSSSRLRQEVERQRLRLAHLEAELTARNSVAEDSPIVVRAGLLLRLLRDPQSVPPSLIPAADAAWLSFWVEVEPEAVGTSFRMRLQIADGDFPWQVSDLYPNPYGALEILLPAHSLPPGEYALEVVPVFKDGMEGQVSRYPFRIADILQSP